MVPRIWCAVCGSHFEHNDKINYNTLPSCQLAFWCRAKDINRIDGVPVRRSKCATVSLSLLVWPFTPAIFAILGLFVSFEYVCCHVYKNMRCGGADHFLGCLFQCAFILALPFIAWPIFILIMFLAFTGYLF